VRLDLPPHPIDLLAHRGGELVLPGGLRAFDFLREDRERGFQAVREITSLRHRSRHTLLAFVEQRIEFVDERFDLGWILAVKTRGAPLADRVQAVAQRDEGRHAATDQRRTGGDEGGAGNQHVRVVDEQRPSGMKGERDAANREGRGEDHRRPNQGAGDEPRAQRPELHAPSIR
jgi:hypothetical protein